MTDAQRTIAVPTTGRSSVLDAWERFQQGDDHVRGVRPEVVVSWHRSREMYRVDPHLTVAPAAHADGEHALEHSVVFAEMGGVAAAATREVEGLNGIVSVTDCTGRVLAVWGDPATRLRADEANLKPWHCWSESAIGTNGMGTALESHGPALVSGPEHWCEAFHNWVCAGVAVRDVVTREPIAVLNVSCWRTPLPRSTAGWLANAVTRAQSILKRRARDSGAELVAAFTQAKGQSSSPLAAVDTAGKVVIANDPASVLMGVPASTPAVDPTVRWNSGLPDIIGAARYASVHAARNPGWVGSTQVFTHLADEPTAVSIRPVFLSGHLVGSLIAFGSSDGERLTPADGAVHPRNPVRRIVGVQDDRMVLLRLPEVSFAESDGNDVWLATDEGRMRAATPGLDKLDAELAESGFLRVHRRYVVNLDRIREIERGPRGEMLLVMEGRERDAVPVSRRNAPAVRRALGI
ncbi:MAG: LytTR family transcriptional regulator DNA-binding domain-containing protein [Pseudonocardia sp.]|uniref:DNA-binding protein n=1 Tax=unclassified Pseudonocardia TaxID=2619320 RepID=UPI00086A0379|nr:MULTISPECIES: DNA-binding protein [unclassified Pseudonocardia]MBN9112236.1 LytTR family transcriptional regulator DNA-binding domain-containing protein [Pseudonocardia sp.]ODU30171.1 MAG: Fis family transcriptional regulator [Pseudonocardia sp. SCN 72-51]ODV03096.1 MAG: Fis family transcriptional regulator [Pseudonocardia sp. SCN 73-27]